MLFMSVSSLIVFWQRILYLAFLLCSDVVFLRKFCNMPPSPPTPFLHVQLMALYGAHPCHTLFMKGEAHKNRSFLRETPCLMWKETGKLF